jgi:cytidine deaminase
LIDGTIYSMMLSKLPVTKHQVEAMLASARAAKENTFPVSGHYSVAVLTKAGNIYPGVSYRSDTRTLTMHAEATALAHAAIHGEKEIVAITGPNCHICKQLLWESAIRSGIDIQVVIMAREGLKLVSISEQMPYPWPDEDGDRNPVPIDMPD